MGKIKHQNAATVVSLAQRCENTKYRQHNKGKWDSRNETRKNYETKRNFAYSQNKMKRNEISLFFVFRETSEISRNSFFVSLCFMFRETKKGCEMYTLVLNNKIHNFCVKLLKIFFGKYFVKTYHLVFRLDIKLLAFT
jgi:hypothetical protein